MLHRTLSKSQHDVADHEENPYGVLFPWFTVLIGIFVYYIISRYAHFVPYTAVMFISGALMGFLSLHTFDNAIIESTRLWLGINGEVILLVFLPGLLFLDSYNINVYLFRQAFSQLLLFAFPMVLAGTSLTALVAYYILPYGWSFDLCMTFGSILAATDPVAVAVLLNELGAPSRLKIHISGESLLNDGSAVVFYHIFSLRFFYELGVEGFGEDIGWLRGLGLFLRLSLGGACIGIIFGVGLVTLLFNFNRRLSQEENVIQVTSTITIAYLAFFTSEIICHTSGIIAVVVCGITTKALGETLLNDSHLTHDFWHITEHLLNSVLFTLGGVVWGGVITSTEKNVRYFGGMDWIYVLLLFGLVVFIRFVLVFTFYPITSRIGIGTNWREAVFMSYGGLRGAVGIALALVLSAKISYYTESESLTEETRNQFREYADKLFGLVGGVAFLTLVINGPTSGPLLRVLGIVTPTITRQRVVAHYYEHMKLVILVDYLSLLAEPCFDGVDLGVIREHVSPLRDISEDDLNTAVEKYYKNCRDPNKTPNLSNIACYVSSSKSGNGERRLARTNPASRLLRTGPASERTCQSQQRQTLYDFNALLDENFVLEERSIFIELLRQEYHRQLTTGELDSRSFIPHCLLQSLDEADKGLPLNDWAASQMDGSTIAKKGDRALHAYRVGGVCNRKKARDIDFHVIRTQVLQALSFINAHRKAQETFKTEFASVNGNALALAEKTVLDESREQVSRADSAINAFDTEDVNAIKSQYICQILLHKSASYFEKHVKNGLMTEKEAGEFLMPFDRDLRKLRLSSELKTKIRQLNRRKIAPELE
ncbi:hypothetical protein ACHAXR_009703, partial [Thalassiosira sp. AJA248-18]